MKDKNCTIFRGVVKGANFMTPNVIGYYGDEKNIAIELSKNDYEAERVFGPMYGVTVVRNSEEGWFHDTKASQPFSSLEEAEHYIDTLIKEASS